MGLANNPGRIQFVNDIFSEALELPASEQAGFVHQRCANDDSLRESVLRLLSQYGRLGDFLQTPACVGLIQHDELEPGEVIGGRFSVVSCLGRGGMGAVYRVEDSVSGDTCALKVLRPQSGAGEQLAARFRDEIRLARSITHDNICRVNELFVEPRGTEKLLFFTMKFLDGPTLAQRLTSGPLDPVRALALAKQIAAGLDAAHRAGVVHRDLKPANIMLVPGPNGGEAAVITDFGVAKSLSVPTADGQTRAGQILGTPEYMAPEQFLGEEISPRTDIFSFGILVYEMVAGRRPFPVEEPLRCALRRILEPAEPLSRYAPSAPPHWTAVMQRALATDPERRYPTAGGMVQELERGVRWSGLVNRRSILYVCCAAALAGTAAILRLDKWVAITPPDRPLLMLAPTQAISSGHDHGLAGRSLDTLLANQLQQSARIRILSRDRMEQAWQRIHGSAEPLPNQVDAASARDIALRAGAQLVLFSALNQVGDEFRLEFNLDLLGAGPAEARKTWRQTLNVRHETDLLSAAFDGSTWIRTTLREGEADLSRRNRPPAELTTRSWQALQEYTRAMDAWRDRQSEPALQYLRSALDLDPEFAQASARLADLLVSLHRYDEGLPHYSRAAAIVAQKNLTDRESLHIRGLFALDTGQLQEADRVFERWCIEYPNESLGYFYRSTSADLLGFQEQGLALAKQAVERDPESYACNVRYAVLLMDAGRQGEAEAGYRRAVAWKASDWSDQFLAALRFNQLDINGVWQALEHMLAQGSPSYQSRAHNFEACLRAEQGRWDEAESLLRAGLTKDERLGANGLVGLFTKRRMLAQLLLARKRVGEAEGLCQIMLSEPHGHRETMQVGCLLAQAGNLGRARSCMVNGLPPWPVYSHWQQRLQGEIALAEGDAGRALDLMQSAGPPALKNEWRWYLVRAALAAGKHDVAATEIIRLIGNPGKYWVQADSAGPGFISWAVQAGLQLHLDDKTNIAANKIRDVLSS
jgi:tetratricopeptide (TPR) repeat protein